MSMYNADFDGVSHGDHKITASARGERPLKETTGTAEPSGIKAMPQGPTNKTKFGTGIGGTLTNDPVGIFGKKKEEDAQAHSDKEGGQEGQAQGKSLMEKAETIARQVL